MHDKKLFKISLKIVWGQYYYHHCLINEESEAKNERHRKWSETSFERFWLSNSKGCPSVNSGGPKRVWRGVVSIGLCKQITDLKADYRMTRWGGLSFPLYFQLSFSMDEQKRKEVSESTKGEQNWQLDEGKSPDDGNRGCLCVVGEVDWWGPRERGTYILLYTFRFFRVWTMHVSEWYLLIVMAEKARDHGWIQV